MESMLAERAVSLSWRLQRVERMQNEAFDALLAEGASLAKLVRSMTGKKSEEDEALALGRAVIKDFANSRVLDRLPAYERRMEHNLLKTLKDLQLRRLRVRVREYISRQMDELDSSGPVDACEAGVVNLCRGQDVRDTNDPVFRRPIVPGFRWRIGRCGPGGVVVQDKANLHRGK